MARTKSSLPSHQPTKYDEERENSSSTEEEEDNQHQLSDEVVADSSPERISARDKHYNSPVPSPRIDPMSMEVFDSDSDSEKSPGEYWVQPIAKVSSSKHSRHEMKASSSKNVKRLKTEKTIEKKEEKKDERETRDEREKGGDFRSKYPNISDSLENMKVNCPSLKLEKGVKKKEEKKDKRENDVEREEEGDFWSKYPNIGESIENMKVNYPSQGVGGMSLSMKKKFSSIGNVKAKEFDDKWKQLAVEKVEMDIRMLKLMKDQLDFARNHK